MGIIAIPEGLQTKLCVLGDNVLKDVPENVKKLWPGKTAVIIADENTWKAAGEKVSQLLKDAGVPQDEPYIFPVEPALHADYCYIPKLREIVKGKAPIAVGSGTINDLTKDGIAFKLNNPVRLGEPTGLSFIWLYLPILTRLVGLQRVADIEGLFHIRRRILFPVRQTSLVVFTRILLVENSGDDGLVLEHGGPTFGVALNESDGLASQFALGLTALEGVFRKTDRGDHQIKVTDGGVTGDGVALVVLAFKQVGEVLVAPFHFFHGFVRAFFRNGAGQNVGADAAKTFLQTFEEVVRNDVAVTISAWECRLEPAPRQQSSCFRFPPA